MFARTFTDFPSPNLVSRDGKTRRPSDSPSHYVYFGQCIFPRASFGATTPPLRGGNVRKKEQKKKEREREKRAGHAQSTTTSLSPPDFPPLPAARWSCMQATCAQGKGREAVPRRARVPARSLEPDSLGRGFDSASEQPKKGKKQEDNGQGRNWKESPVVMQFRRSAPGKRWCSS